jgi:hypothetical protein
MKSIINKFMSRLLPLLAAVVCMTVGSCEKNELTDGDKFSLFYPGITDIGPSTNMNLNPTYHGEKPTDFKIYKVTLDGQDYQTECFLVDAESGQVQLRKTDELPVGLYSLSISCKSAGTYYEFPDAIQVNMMRPIPEGITVEPASIMLTLADVTDLNSLKELPTAQISTVGEHISIKNYYISSVKRGDAVVEDWSGLFEVNSAGKVTILKNQNFAAGTYSLSFKLTTMVVGNDSQDGIFSDALTVDVVSPPISLEYQPAVAKVEVEAGYTSAAPIFAGSATDLQFSLKAVIPESAPVAVDAKTGAVTLAASHKLTPGESVIVSVSARNAYGEKDFDQVLRMDVVAFIAPITKFDYNDSTVWQNTKYSIQPVEVDGDEKTFSFVDLPETLAALTIDELTGVISAKKGNAIPVGDYVVKVKVENPKGSLTDEIKLKVVENPYFFTYVRWGNNLGLTPEENYASQHRVSATEPYEFGITATDLKEGAEVKYRIKENDGSNPNCAVIDSLTGRITTDPSVLTGIDNKRAHFFFVVATSGEGTPGETQVMTPVFLDFNCIRAEGGYQIEYTPFVFQCNPKTGGYSASPKITKVGVELTAEERAKITMDFRRSFRYWNIDGPESHGSGALDKNDATTFLYKSIWTDYYKAINVAFNAGSRDPMSAYGRAKLNDIHWNNSPGYIRTTDLALYIAPEKWRDENGYADGIFTGQITFADTGADPQGAGSPYRLFPLFVWFDTEF